MPVSGDFKAFIRELLAPFGPVTIRPMFGAAGVFALTPEGKLMFGIVADDTLYFKTDEQTRADFETEGAEEFVFVLKGNRRVPSGYLSVPGRRLDDPEEFKSWAEKAFAVARRAAARKGGKGRKRRSR